MTDITFLSQFSHEDEQRIKLFIEKLQLFFNMQLDEVRVHSFNKMDLHIAFRKDCTWFIFDILHNEQRGTFLNADIKEIWIE